MKTTNKAFRIVVVAALAILLVVSSALAYAMTRPKSMLKAPEFDWGEGAIPRDELLGGSGSGLNASLETDGFVVKYIHDDLVNISGKSSLERGEDLEVSVSAEDGYTVSAVTAKVNNQTVALENRGGGVYALAGKMVTDNVVVTPTVVEEHPVGEYEVSYYYNESFTQPMRTAHYTAEELETRALAPLADTELYKFVGWTDGENALSSISADDFTDGALKLYGTYALAANAEEIIGQLYNLEVAVSAMTADVWSTLDGSWSASRKMDDYLRVNVKITIDSEILTEIIAQEGSEVVAIGFVMSSSADVGYEETEITKNAELIKKVDGADRKSLAEYVKENNTEYDWDNVRAQIANDDANATAYTYSYRWGNISGSLSQGIAVKRDNLPKRFFKPWVLATVGGEEIADVVEAFEPFEAKQITLTPFNFYAPNFVSVDLSAEDFKFIEDNAAYVITNGVRYPHGSNKGYLLDGTRIQIQFATGDTEFVCEWYDADGALIALSEFKKETPEPGPEPEIPETYALEQVENQDNYLGSNLVGRWVYFREASSASGTYDKGVLTFTFSNNVNNWWCTQLFYKNPSFTTGSNHKVKMTLNADFDSQITVKNEGGVNNIIELKSGEDKLVEFEFTQTAQSTIVVLFGVETGNQATVEAGTLIISNIEFSDATGGGGGEDTPKVIDVFNAYLDPNNLSVLVRGTGLTVDDFSDAELRIGDSFVANPFLVEVADGNMKLHFKDFGTLEGSAEGVKHLVEFFVDNKTWNPAGGGSYTDGTTIYSLSNSEGKLYLTVTEIHIPDPGEVVELSVAKTQEYNGAYLTLYLSNELEYNLLKSQKDAGQLKVKVNSIENNFADFVGPDAGNWKLNVMIGDSDAQEFSIEFYSGDVLIARCTYTRAQADEPQDEKLGWTPEVVLPGTTTTPGRKGN